INGDITKSRIGIELVKKYGVDGVMIGRGVITNPFAFEKEPQERNYRDFLKLLMLQLDLHDQYSTELDPRLFKPLRRFFKIYVRGFRGASELRNQLMKTESTDEVRTLLQPFLDKYELEE